MSILDIKKQIKKYTLFTIFILILGIIYEMFSHNVYSKYMYLAFLIPMFGLVVTFINYKFKIQVDNLSNKFFNYSVITLTIGSLIEGVLDIYGTTNKLVYIYLLAAIFFISISLVIRIIKS